MSSNNMPSARKAGGLGVRIASNPQWTSFQNKKDPETGCPALDKEVGYKKDIHHCTVVKKPLLTVYGRKGSMGLSLEEEKSLQELLLKKDIKKVAFEIENSFGEYFVRVKNQNKKVFLTKEITLYEGIKRLI